jgi:hypothetical protein
MSDSTHVTTGGVSEIRRTAVLVIILASYPWTLDDLTRVAYADELEIAARRPDGTLRKGVTIWVVRLGDSLYVRSVNGPGAAWFLGARATHAGRISAGGVEKDVTFVEADEAVSRDRGQMITGGRSGATNPAAPIQARQIDLTVSLHRSGEARGRTSRERPTP